MDGGDAAGVIVLLKYPYPHEVSEPIQYDLVKVHANMGGVPSESDQQQRLSVTVLQPLHIYRIVYVMH